MKKEWWIVLLFLSVCAYAYAGGHARGSGFNEGVLEMADYPILFDESEDDPGIPNSDRIQLYAKDKAGTTTLYTQDALGTVTEVGAGGGGHTIQEEGNSLTARTNLNFVGAGVTVTDGGAVPNSSIVTIGAGSMVYPGAGIPLSTGAAWDTSITNNSSNWNTAYTDRLKWDGGSTGLTAATGRTSLGLGSVYAYNVGTLTDGKVCVYSSATTSFVCNTTISGTGDVTQDQSTPQTIGATGARLAKLWATDVTSSSFTADGVSSDANSLMNNVGVGVASASVTAYLHIKAGTASAGTAPIKLTSGTNLTTPEAGVWEFDGTNLYFSV